MGLYGEARSKLQRYATQRGMSQAEIGEILSEFGISFADI